MQPILSESKRYTFKMCNTGKMYNIGKMCNIGARVPGAFSPADRCDLTAAEGAGTRVCRSWRRDGGSASLAAALEDLSRK